MIEKLQQENAHWRTALEDSQRQLSQWEAILTNTGGSRAPFATGNFEVDERIRELHESLERYKAAYLKTKGTLELTMKPFEEQQKLLQETQSSLAESTRQCRALMDEAQRCAKAEAELKRLQAEMANSMRDKENLLDTHFEDVLKLKKEKRDMESTILDLRSSLRTALEKEAKLSKQVADATIGRTPSKVHTLEQQLASAEAREAMLKNEVESLEARIKLFTASEPWKAPDSAPEPGAGFTAHDFEIMRIQLEQEQADLAKYKRLYKASEDEKEAVRAMNGDLVGRLNVVEKAMQSKIDQLNRTNDKLQDELDRLRRLPAQPQPFPAAQSDALMDDDLSDISEHQNVFELVIESARFENHMEPDVSTFFTMDFFDHPTQLSTRQTGRSPKYDTIIQFIVPMDFNFLKYLATSVLQLELHQVHGFDFTAIGRAQLVLSQAKHDLEVSPNAPTRRHLEVRGAADRLLGKVTVTFRTLRPILPFVRQHQERLARQMPQHPDEFMRFAANAARCPSRASGIRVTIQSCQDLIVARGAASRPYVSYQFPGYPKPVDSPFGEGASPRFGDVHMFEFGEAPQSSPEFTKALRAFALQLVVFDGAEEGAAAQVGVANVALRPLVEDSRMVAGRFALTHPETDKPAGSVDLLIEWADLLGKPQHGVPPAVMQKLAAGQAPLAPLASQHVAPDENVIEVTLVDASIQDGVLAPGQQVHGSFGFFTFQRSSSPSIASLSPAFKYSVEFKVPMSSEFLGYMENRTLPVAFFKLDGWEAAQFGSATISLREVVDAFAAGHGVGQFPVTFSAHIISETTSQMLGQCKVSFRCLHPVKDALLAFRSRPSGVQASSKGQPGPPAGGALPAPLPGGGAAAPRPASPQHPPGGGASVPQLGSPQHAPGGAEHRYSALSDSIDAPPSSLAVAVKTSGSPTTWPTDLDNSMVICVESVQLMAPLLNNKSHTGYAVFWSLLDLVDDAFESTKVVQKSALMAFSEATAYRLRGVTPEQRQAQGRLIECLQLKSELAFALAATSGQQPEGLVLVGETDPVRLWDIMETEEYRWKCNRVPLFDPGTRQHVADLVVTIVAQRALRSLWEMHSHDV